MADLGLLTSRMAGRWNEKVITLRMLMQDADGVGSTKELVRVAGDALEEAGFSRLGGKMHAFTFISHVLSFILFLLKVE